MNNADFLLPSVESSPCTTTCKFENLKVKSNELVDLRNLSLNMLVFVLELSIFEADSEYEL